MVAIFGLAATFLGFVVAGQYSLSEKTSYTGILIPSSPFTDNTLTDKYGSTTSNGLTCALDPACFCSSDVIKLVVDCYECGAGTGALDQKTIDDALTGYRNMCRDAGHNVDISNTGGNGGNTGGASSNLQMSSFAAAAAAAVGGLFFL
ncbi:hypothetical protein CVT24_000422 [Panaeolus cyanescens]|uniref:Extracellular membrane protein CFEM domain-containing protein n=1 Tax=Panaeolus cyanescens TaxID=181874 RepID=A0A409YDM5_9AGAR|nr:hypothetical protein CVT24_000422 [Panaeolus cyanescens]